MAAERGAEVRGGAGRDTPNKRGVAISQPWPKAKSGPGGLYLQGKKAPALKTRKSEYEDEKSLSLQKGLIQVALMPELHAAQPRPIPSSRRKKGFLGENDQTSRRKVDRFCSSAQISARHGPRNSGRIRLLIAEEFADRLGRLRPPSSHAHSLFFRSRGERRAERGADIQITYGRLEGPIKNPTLSALLERIWGETGSSKRICAPMLKEGASSNPGEKACPEDF